MLKSSISIDYDVFSPKNIFLVHVEVLLSNGNIPLLGVKLFVLVSEKSSEVSQVYIRKIQAF